MTAPIGNPQLNATFAALREAGETAFIPFIMAGDPGAAETAALLAALPTAGADVIELGMPFSDPTADGPVIQAAGQRALAAGMTVKGCLKLVQEFRQQHSTPIILMGYANPVYAYGIDAFATDAAAAGVNGVILVDVPMEEQAEFSEPLHAAGLDFIRLLTPTSQGNRLQALAQEARGFLYYISVAGITGVQQAVEAQVQQAIAQVRQVSTLPVGIGFGIKTPEQAQAMAAYADAVIVGSALVECLHTQGVEATVAKARHLAQAVKQKGKQ